MRKSILTMLLLCGSALLSYAEKETIYDIYEDGNPDISGSFYYIIDRDAKTFVFDTDSEDDANMIIKNYKKSGTKETFDLYPKVSPTKKHCSVVIKQNSEGKNVMSITYTGANYTRSYVIGSLEDKKAYQKSRKGSSTSSSSSTESVSKESLTDKAKDKGKSLLNKGKSLFKKK